MLQHFKDTFIKGGITILPLFLTCYLFYWLVFGTEKIVKSIVISVLPEEYYLPGCGIVAVLAMVYLVGLVASAWIGRKLVSYAEEILEKVPLIKTVYGSIKDLLNYFDISKKDNISKPVLVFFENFNVKMLGFITQDNLYKLSSGDNAHDLEDCIAVYLPMSYQVGGYMLLLPKSAVTPLDMSIEEAMQYAVTAGVLRNSTKNTKS